MLQVLTYGDCIKYVYFYYYYFFFLCQERLSKRYTFPNKMQKDSHFKQPLSDDGLFEVIGVAGVAHLGRLKMSVSHGLRLGQGSKLKLINVRAIAAQNDGEPWILPPSTTTVTFYNQSTMLFNIRKGVKHLRKLVGSTVSTHTQVLCCARHKLQNKGLCLQVHSLNSF